MKTKIETSVDVPKGAYILGDSKTVAKLNLTGAVFAVQVKKTGKKTVLDQDDYDYKFKSGVAVLVAVDSDPEDHIDECRYIELENDTSMAFDENMLCVFGGHMEEAIIEIDFDEPFDMNDDKLCMQYAMMMRD